LSDNKLSISPILQSGFKGMSSLLLIAAACVAGCASSSIAPTKIDTALYQRAAASPIRTPEDRASDASRKPIEFLKFARVLPGMQILDLAAGSGNTTQLLALAVGDSGKVYAQNPTLRPALEKRLSNNPQTNIIPIVRPFDDAIPAGAPLLDLITINLSYHDIANLPIDRIKMVRRLLDALKPGGHLVLVDHAATVGTGLAHTKTLHRIDENLVRADFQEAGFSLEESGDYLRHPADNHERKSSEIEGMTDKFALRFVKPG
jgi:predicted methyltransferase